MRCFSLGTIVLVGVLLGAQGVKAQSPSCTGDDPVEGVLWGIADDGGDGTYVAGTGGVIRSCNGGDTWTTPSPLQRSGLSVLVHPLNSSTIYFGTDRGVYRSTDFGSSYSPTGDNISGFVFSLGAQPDGTLFAGADSGIYRSDDDGNTWNALAGSPTGENIIALAVDPSNDQIIYAGTNGNGVYQSTDGGATWNAASNGNALWQVRDIEFDPVNPSILNVPSWDGIWRSVDAGANWNNLGFSRVVDMAFDPNDGTRAYAASWDFGVLRSTDGGTSWSALNTSFPTNRLYSLQVLSSGRVLVGTESEGLFRSDDGGDTWGLAGTPIPDPAPPPAPTPGYASLSAEVENLMGGSVAAGSQARFRITVTNDGPDTSTASSVDFSWVRNRLTGNVGYGYTLTTNQGSCMRSITPEPDCTIGTLAAGASVIIEFRGDTEPAALSNYILRVFANNNESAGGRVAEVTVGSRITVLSSDGGGGTLGYLTLLWLSWGLWSRKKTATMPKKTNVR